MFITCDYYFIKNPGGNEPENKREYFQTPFLHLKMSKWCKGICNCDFKYVIPSYNWKKTKYFPHCSI